MLTVNLVKLCLIYQKAIIFMTASANVKEKRISCIDGSFGKCAHFGTCWLSQWWVVLFIRRVMPMQCI